MRLPTFISIVLTTFWTILFVANSPNSKVKGRKSQSVVLTTKQGYLWAAFLAIVAEDRPDISSEQIVQTVTTQALPPKYIRRAYSEFQIARMRARDMESKSHAG